MSSVDMSHRGLQVSPSAVASHSEAGRDVDEARYIGWQWRRRRGVPTKEARVGHDTVMAKVA
jgi:hypothetical protein